MKNPIWDMDTSDALYPSISIDVEEKVGWTESIYLSAGGQAKIELPEKEWEYETHFSICRQCGSRVTGDGPEDVHMAMESHRMLQCSQ